MKSELRRVKYAKEEYTKQKEELRKLHKKRKTDSLIDDYSKA